MRNLPLDLLRILACLMVILMHSPIPGDDALNNGVFLTALSYFTTPCVPLFFMVSGALLLKADSREMSVTDWLKRRLSKVVFPTVIFSIIYIVLNSPSENWLSAIISIPFSSQGHGVLWFMYTLIGLYLITPVIKPWLKSATEKDVRLYLIIWGITLLFPFLGGVVGINTSTTGILYYFSGFIGYYVLGYYLIQWGLSRKAQIILYTLTVLVLPLPLLNKVFGWNLDFYSAFWYLSAPVCIMTMAWFCIISRLFKNTSTSFPILTTISNLCFGVYLVHIAIMRNWLWEVDFIKEIDNYYVQTGVAFLGSVVFSFIVCWVISWLPFGHYIIGYKQKRG